jgi:hypothetical protein
MIEAETLTKTAAEARTFGFDFSQFPELQAGKAIAAIVELSSTPSGLAINASIFPPATVGVLTSGGTAGAVYLLKCDVRLDDGTTILAGRGYLAVDESETP